LLATRGTARLLVGVVAVGCGLALVAGAGYGATLAGDAGRTALAAGIWPWLAVAGGLAVTAAGVLAVLRSRGWPAMSARYQRAESAPAAPAPDATAEPSQLWDALDSGADPTDRR
ncbi:MAG: Trp biosynthesis-associated membrane protein, partial [Micromonosporaceae bacterium]